MLRTILRTLHIPISASCLAGCSKPYISVPHLSRMARLRHYSDRLWSYLLTHFIR